MLTWPELAEVRPHPSLVGDDAGITGIGFGLPAVGVAGAIHAESWDVKHFLITFPQKGQQERRATPRLIYGPEDLLSQRESVVYEPQDVCLVVLDLPGEKLCARSVQYVSPVKLFASVYACPRFIH